MRSYMMVYEIDNAKESAFPAEPGLLTSRSDPSVKPVDYGRGIVNLG